MNRWLSCFVVMFFYFVPFLECEQQEKCVNSVKSEQLSFINSFVKCYDFTVVGRYTHAYHSFLFQKTSYSLDELEKNLTAQGLNVKGRIVVAGYEEQASPLCYTNYKACTGSKINDESCSKDLSGWSLQLHNTFGLMTGFLFRDCSAITKFCKENGKKSLFEHINVDLISIYGNDAWVFQKHAFGNVFDLMCDAQDIVNKQMICADYNGMFATLINFWKILYDNELKNGDRQVLGTQDVLFSISHAEHLFRSDIPLLKYYTGPDITYPIKVSDMQKKAATFHAQTFVKKFVKKLKPLDDKPTAYIFCSFVDGVGKSTLLGNVQNYKEFADQFQKFKPVDNSSSQLAEIYNYDEKVYIADLPAQMSHFIYKPDGMVYVDSKTIVGEDDIDELQSVITKQKSQLINQWNDTALFVKNVIAKNGWFAPCLDDQNNPANAFAKNLFLLKKETSNVWVPFKYKKKNYLFNVLQPFLIKVLVLLNDVDSSGLKNSDPEQMLFFEGLRFPVRYQKFVKDLIDRLKEKNIENVVFVDFLSMYPRSSRENIRVNYLLQQLALLDEDFDLSMSPYRKFTDDAQLYYVLKKDREKRILNTFRNESLIRLALYNIINKQLFDTVDGVRLSDVTKLLKTELKLISDDVYDEINKVSVAKLQQEMNILERVHGLTKSFVNVQDLAFEDIKIFSKKLQKIFKNVVANKRLNALWKKPDDILDDVESIADGFVDKVVTLQDQSEAKLLYLFSPQCRNETLIAPVLRMLRASWYAAVSNIIGCLIGSDGKILVEKDLFYVAPLFVKKTIDGRIAILRRLFDDLEEESLKEDEMRKNFELLNISKKANSNWGRFKGKSYLLNPEVCSTHCGLYAFGCNLIDFSSYRWPWFSSLIFNFVRKYKEVEKPDVVMPAMVLWQKLENDHWWLKYDFKEVVEKARKNKEMQTRKKDQDSNNFEEKNRQTKNKFYEMQQKIQLGSYEQEESCRLAIRALATLEMTLKDVKSDIIIRRGSRQDFIAALKLFEKVLLPTYFGIIFEHDLFDDYYEVEPIIKFEEWE